jgi:hypothetical protein
MYYNSAQYSIAPKCCSYCFDPFHIFIQGSKWYTNVRRRTARSLSPRTSHPISNAIVNCIWKLLQLTGKDNLVSRFNWIHYLCRARVCARGGRGCYSNHSQRRVRAKVQYKTDRCRTTLSIRNKVQTRGSACSSFKHRNHIGYMLQFEELHDVSLILLHKPYL